MEERFEFLDDFIPNEPKNEEVSKHRTETRNECDRDWGIDVGKTIKNGERRSDGEREHVKHAGEKHAEISERADICDDGVRKFRIGDQKKYHNTDEEKSGIAILPMTIIGYGMGEMHDWNNCTA